jgi:hypothetical protein
MALQKLARPLKPPESANTRFREPQTASHTQSFCRQTYSAQPCAQTAGGVEFSCGPSLRLRSSGNKREDKMSGTLRLQLQTRCRHAKRVGTQGTRFLSFFSQVILNLERQGKKNDFSVFSVFFGFPVFFAQVVNLGFTA